MGNTTRSSNRSSQMPSHIHRQDYRSKFFTENLVVSGGGLVVARGGPFATGSGTSFFARKHLVCWPIWTRHNSSSCREQCVVAKARGRSQVSSHVTLSNRSRRIGRRRCQKAFPMSGFWSTAHAQETSGARSYACCLLLLLNTYITSATGCFLCTCGTPRARSKSFHGHFPHPPYLSIYLAQDREPVFSGWTDTITTTKTACSTPATGRWPPTWLITPRIPDITNIFTIAVTLHLMLQTHGIQQCTLIPTAKSHRQWRMDSHYPLCTCPWLRIVTCNKLFPAILIELTPSELWPWTITASDRQIGG